MWSDSSPTLLPTRAMSREVVLQDRKVRHRDAGHGRILGISVFHHDEIASPRLWLLEQPALHITHELIDRERHSIAGDNRVEDDVGRGELLCHAVKSFDRLLKQKHESVT